MEYNSSRGKLILPEFGRNLQNIVTNLSLVKDREERTRLAYCLVNVMTHLVGGIQDGDFNHKMWDQLYIMSDYKLDVDSPYPRPVVEEIAKKPGKVDYNVNNIKYRHYGNLIFQLIKKTEEMKDGEEKEQIIASIASQMKRLYLTWNRDTVDDDLIFMNLNVLSNNMLHVNPELRLASTATFLSQDKKKILNKKNINKKSQNLKKKKHN